MVCRARLAHVRAARSGASREPADGGGFPRTARHSREHGRCRPRPRAPLHPRPESFDCHPLQQFFAARVASGRNLGCVSANPAPLSGPPVSRSAIFSGPPLSSEPPEQVVSFNDCKPMPSPALRVLLSETGFEPTQFRRLGCIPVLAKSMIALARRPLNRHTHRVSPRIRIFLARRSRGFNGET